MKGKNHIKLGLVAVVVALMVALPILVVTGGGRVLGNPGELPRLMSYQGRLTDASGTPLTDGSYSIEFRLYSVDTAGIAAWSETQNVAVSAGLFNVLLGSVTPIPLACITYPLYLEVVVAGDVMTPRQQLVSVPFAFCSDVANNADMVDGMHSGEFAPASHGHTGTDIANNAITSAHIADGNIGTADIANNAVTDAKIQSVAWSKLTGVPAGFADGVDNVGTGGGSSGITAVSAGTGLTGGGTDGEVSLALDSSHADGSAYDDRFVNEGQSGSVTSTMIVDGSVASADVAFNYAGSSSKGGKASDSDLLDGLTSSQFVRSDENVATMSGDLRLNGIRLHMNYDGPDGTQFLYFYEGGSGTGEALKWVDSSNRFEFSDDLYIDGTVQATTVQATTVQATTVQANKVTYSTARTHYLSLGGQDFALNQVVGAGLWYVIDDGASICAGMDAGGSMLAPVHLPHNARVTQFKVFFYDEDASKYVDVRLQRVTLANGDEQLMTWVDSSGINGFGSKTETTISYDLIDNTTYSYRVSAGWGIVAAPIKVMGVLITYIISEAE